MTYEQLIYDLIKNDNRYIVMTSENRSAMRNITSKIKNNFIDVGIAEQTMIGMAAGLALRGRVPIVHALATFLTMRAFEFIRTDVGIAKLPVKIVGSVPGFLSEANGPTHQAIEDVSIMRGIPNLNVFCPSDEDDMIKCLPKIFDSPSAFYIRYNNNEALFKHNDFEIGKGEQIGEGKDVALIVYGFLFNQTLKAKELLESKGLSVRLINVRTPKPIDEELIISAAKDCKLVVTIEDHLITGGLFSILSEILLQNKLTTEVLPIALMNRWFKPALLNDVLEYEGSTGEKISEKIFQKYNNLN